MRQQILHRVLQSYSYILMPWRRTHILIAHRRNLMCHWFHAIVIWSCYLPSVSLEPAIFRSRGERYKHTVTWDDVYSLRIFIHQICRQQDSNLVQLQYQRTHLATRPLSYISFRGAPTPCWNKVLIKSHQNQHLIVSSK